MGGYHISEFYLHNQARCAHWYHRYETKLRIRAAARGLDITPAQLAAVAPISGTYISFNPDEGGIYGIADYVVDNIGVIGVPGAPDVTYTRWCALAKKEEEKYTLNLDQGHRILRDHEVPAAFAAAHCEHIEKLDLSMLSAATRAQLAGYKTFFPAASVEERALLRGATPPKVAVAELLATYNPARWISSPDVPAYALVVRPGCTINKGDPICLYAGRMWTQDRFDARFQRSNLQYYAYDVPPVWSGVDIIERCRNASLIKPPQLVVEALGAGGVGRFINDCWAREGGKATVNVEPRAIWDAEANAPAIVMVAIKRIKQHEELVADYGEAFWEVAWRDLRVMQTEFWRRCAARVKKLEERLEDAGIPLPELPEPLAGPLFIGSAPRIDPALDDSKNAAVGRADSDSEGGRRRQRRLGAAAGASSLAAALTGDS